MTVRLEIEILAFQLFILFGQPNESTNAILNESAYHCNEGEKKQHDSARHPLVPPAFRR